jgi:hypothetical protein
MTQESEVQSPIQKLSQLFGSYKAEWLREKIYDLFTEPSYFPELLTPRPCILIGGRGTGKTTALRSLSYEGQFALSKKNKDKIAGWQHIGLYYRVNPNRVTAFKGPELSDIEWIRVFGHYINLVLCDLIVRFLQWHAIQSPNIQQLSSTACSKVTTSLHLENANSVRELVERIAFAQISFEAYINNIVDDKKIGLSLQGAPVDVLLKEVAAIDCYKGKMFFFLLDEYENFENYQQQVVNTLIKHPGDSYTFKIGVRELGWRCRSTLNLNELLTSPADYARINIVDKLEGETFKEFAKNVCNHRVSVLGIDDISSLLPGISVEQEAEILDEKGNGLARKASTDLESVIEKEHLSLFGSLSLLEKYFIIFWSENEHISIRKSWLDFINNREAWKARYDNYKHALIYTLRRGKRGIQKYYCGWDVFTHLAAGNIRYLLELVEQSLLMHLNDRKGFDEPLSAEIQTITAQEVGKKNLSELEGLSEHGGKLMRLLLGLGRIFQTMAADLLGHAPEVNQLHISSDLTAQKVEIENLNLLITSAVMHLALIRFPATKLTSNTETRDYDYMPHPIFSPFFVYSSRRKRKMTITPKQILNLIEKPKEAIRDVLSCQNRTTEEPLPLQLELFKDYYAS